MCFQFFKDMSGGDDSDASVVPVGNSTDNANAEDSSHPSDGNDSTQKAPNDTDSKEKSIWQNDLGEELYWILIQCLSIFHPKGDQVETDESTRPQMENFYRNKENKRNFHISKNTKKWKYEFCVDDNDVVQKFDDGLPKLIINRKSDTTPENASHKVGNNHKKVVVPIEKVPAVLRSIHNNIDVAGRLQSCNSGGQAKLLKAFNKNYHFYGIRKCVEEFLSSCPTCQATMQLPQMKAPPIPIRTHFPHQRLQMDLIQMASKKKQHMILNPWRFSYILSVKCCFSKYGWLFPLRNKKIDGVYLAVKFLCEKEGFPEYMQSDNGKEFVGNIIKEFFKSREVKIKHGRPRHPQSQGQVENLNKTVKQQLRRILCVLPGKEEQGKLWPLLLPGIASNYNNMYHHTINDVPFRVYHNREPGQLKHCVAPEDYDWCMQAGIKSKTSGESDEHSDEEDEDDDEEEDIPEEEVPPVSSEEQMMSLSDLLQSCASASLSSDFLSQRQNQQIESNFDDTDLSSTDDFETVNFQSCLYSLAKNSEWLRYSALENTEYTIHRNFKQSMKSHKNSIFKIGQRVLFRNPDLNKYTYKTFSFDKLNIVGTVKEVSGHMYKVEVQEGESKCVKSVFKGEMVPLADGDEGNGEEDENDHSNNNNNFSLTSVLNSITDVGAKTRESIYNHSTRFRNKQMTDVCSYMSRYFSALDKELSAKLATDPVLADQLSSESNSIIHDLRKHGFGFFMYGSWAWENSRKDILPTHIIDFVKDQHPSFMADHQCVDCFQSTDSCSHECCFFMAKDFAERTGLQVIKKKAPKENTTNKEPEDGDEQIDGSSTQTKRNSRKRKQDDPMTKKRKKSKPTKTSSAAAKKLNTQKQKNEATNKTRGPALPISAFSVSLVQPQPTLNQPQGIPKQTQFKGVPVVTYKPPTTSSNQTILPLGVPVVTYKPPTTSSNQTILPLGVPVVTYKPPTTSSNQTILPLGLNSVPHHNSNVPSTRTVLPKGLIDSLAHHKSTVPSTSTILPKGLIDSLAHHKSTVPSTSTILPEGLNSVPRHKSNVSSTRTVLPKGVPVFTYKPLITSSASKVSSKGLNSVPHHKSTVPSASAILSKDDEAIQKNLGKSRSLKVLLPTMKSEKSSNQHHVFQPKPSSNQTTTLLASSVPTSEAGKNERIDIIGDCNSVTKPIKSVEFSTNNNNMKDSSCKEDEQVCEASEEFQVMTYKNGALEAKYDDKNWSDDPSSSDDDLPTISDALKSQNFHELRDDSSNNNVKTSHLPDLDVPRISSLSQNEKAKIILTDLFGFECAQECLAQNDHVDERHINAFKKQKWVPNSVHRLGLLNIEEFTPFHFNELQNVLASKQSSLCVCDKCHKRLRDSKECINCFKQFHRRCYGPDEICFCCNSIIESEKKIQLEFEKKESEAMERSRSWDQVEHFLKKTMNNGDLALLFKESSDPVKNVLLSLDGLEKGSRYASNMKSLLMENPEFKKLFDQSQHAEDSIDKNGLMTAFIMKHFPVGIGSTGFAKIQFMKMKLIDKFLTPINAEDHVGEN
ncbi:serine-rich adhesin for platelets-like isoform X35 [Clytia hemisphaerica]|uniref:serine-rich adhesin for platelets-like isoform X35 n=1 Tax=Clytia hemisphaerica TaxID=252671 RepID=UPI0034D47F85